MFHAKSHFQAEINMNPQQLSRLSQISSVFTWLMQSHNVCVVSWKQTSTRLPVGIPLPWLGSGALPYYIHTLQAFYTKMTATLAGD